MRRERGRAGQLPGERMIEDITIRGRRFAPEDLLKIRAVVMESPEAHRFALSKRVCEVLGWRQPNGRLKDRACRDVLARLEERGVLRLPPPRRVAVRRRAVSITDRTAPRSALTIRPLDVDRASFSIVTGSGDVDQERLWNEYVERYHYLGYGVPLGAHLKYFVHVQGECIACLAFSGAAWRVEARDRWIRWDDAQRGRRLRYVVSNTRFLIFPWISVPNLASRLLSVAVRRLRDDWSDRYAYRPLVLETFVDGSRHTGACYRAAGWRMVGQTKGRGRMDRNFTPSLPKKMVLVYPLVKDATEQLRDG